MVNQRFKKSLQNLRGKEFFQAVQRIQKMRPDGTQVPKAAAIDPRERLPMSELPFMKGDRVQITSGADKGKVGYVVDRYPNLGNAFYIAGVGVSKIVNPIENKALETEDNQYEPVVDNYKVVDYESLRLVSKMKTEDGKEEDVAIHSVVLGPERYDQLSNTHRRARFAKYDRSIEVPWPTQKVEKIESGMTTPAPFADLRSHFISSARESPLPLGAIPQVTNLNNRFRRARYAPKITEAQLAKAQPPAMPLPPRTQKLLAELAALPKPPKVKFTKDIEGFLSQEIKKGLDRRRSMERAALDSYQ